MKAVKILGALALTLGLMAGAAHAQVKVGDKVPPINLPNAQGEMVDVNALDGWVVLEWVNYDCPFVKKHYSVGHMQKLQEALQSEGVTWLSINSSAPGKQGHFSGEELLARIKKEGSKASHYLIDEDGTVGKAMGAKTTPHMYIISPDDTLAYQGAIDSIKSANPKDIDKADNYVMLAYKALKAGLPIQNASTPPYGCSVKY